MIKGAGSKWFNGAIKNLRTAAGYKILSPLLLSAYIPRLASANYRQVGLYFESALKYLPHLASIYSDFLHIIRYFSNLVVIFIG